MEQFHKNAFSTQIGLMQLSCQNDAVVALNVVTAPDNQNSDSSCLLCVNAKQQLQEYLNGHRQAFDIPVQLHGSKLQLAVWQYLQSIPFGATVSYSDVANAVGCKSVRAVATAVGQNPVPIIIPCHRVIRKSGAIGKFSLVGPEVKKFLLQLESDSNQA